MNSKLRLPVVVFDGEAQGVAFSENPVPDIQFYELRVSELLNGFKDHQGYALGDLMVLVDKFFG